ncbi:hypothetical protein CLV94_2940 [Flavobacterium endophyticum]|uniref:Uncharacterized protein n=2 Tax=Flavobacterium endophyticum TaxID=1540163 RepID=A0A495M3Q1_9FLAO|nr:hypothetical protein CLV94_2940 [Flavobacterium endophyticum]
MNNTFPIFIPRKKIKLRYHNILYILVVFCILAFMIKLYVTPINYFFIKFFTPLFGILMIIYVILIFVSYFIKEPLSGALSGKLVFNPENVFINDEIIDISRIEDIDLMIGSYDNQRIEYSSRSITPKIFNGTDNAITFYFTDGAKYSIHFQQEFSGHYLSIKPFVISLVKTNKISILRATTILKINDYDDIQEFKKEINKKELQV